MPEGTTPTGTENVGTPAASAPPATTPAPSTPIASPTPATSDATPARPKSFQEALQKASTAASSAEPVVPPGTPPADAKTPPEVPTGPESDAAWLGIPEPRRNTILQNARKAERDQILKAVDARFGWAKDIDPVQGQQWVGIAQGISQNPVQFAIDLISEIRGVPSLRQAFDQAFHGSGIEVPQPQAQWSMPKGELAAENGTRAFSEAQVVDILNNYKSQIVDEVRGEIGPLNQWRESQEEREAVVNTIHETREETAQIMSEMRQMPYFAGNEPKIAEVLDAISPQVKQRIGAVAALQLAYNVVLRDHVFPQIEATAEERARARMVEKAAAGTGGIPPAAPTPQVRPKKPTNPQELAEHMKQLAAASA